MPVIIGAAAAVVVLAAGAAMAATIDPGTPEKSPNVAAPADPPRADDPTTAGSPTVVVPRPGMVHTRAVRWDTAEPDGARAVVLTYIGGLEP
ncbi:MAG TPA: hypothetical protein VGR21_03670, partial [Cryptosporangiaceae bacterium]|nr:hypothetical protein [Cryptosporangiaceae bacterium]